MADYRGHEFWVPEPLWQGHRAFILGGGPSLRGFDYRRLGSFGKVLAINSALSACPQADALYFTDHSWLESRVDQVEQFQGLVISASRQAKAEYPELIKRVPLALNAQLATAAPILRMGRSSGQTAISVAIALGADPVILLGYDMRIVEGRSHHHDEYGTTEDRLFSKDFLPPFRGWQAAAQRAGKTVMNATPGSALLEFPAVELDSLLTL